MWTCSWLGVLVLLPAVVRLLRCCYPSYRGDRGNTDICHFRPFWPLSDSLDGLPALPRLDIAKAPQGGTGTRVVPICTIFPCGRRLGVSVPAAEDAAH